jgi:hypothetical protein
MSLRTYHKEHEAPSNDLWTYDVFLNAWGESEAGQHETGCGEGPTSWQYRKFSEAIIMEDFSL